MPHLVITDRAARGIKRCSRFLVDKNPYAATRALDAIDQRLLLLKTMPEIGRPFLEAPELRELLIDVGDSGYVALYRYVPADNAVYVLAFRHQKEARY